MIVIFSVFVCLFVCLFQQNALDLDQAEMEKELSKGAWSEAHHLYMDGAHSELYANLTLMEPLKKKVSSGTRVNGTSFKGETAIGKTMNAAQAGETAIQVRYHVHEEQDSYVDCQVGALWRIHKAKLDGCK